MKNIFKFFAVAALAATITSCEDEQDLIYVTPPASFQIVSPTSGESVVLNPENQSNPALTLVWEGAQFGTATEINYTVQVAANGSTEFTDLASTTETFTSVNAAALNTAAVAAGLFPFVEGGLDVRVKATVGAQPTEEGTAYSNTITYLVTPFSTDLPKLGIPGNHQGWNPSAADLPVLAASAYGETDFEGYAWLDGEYKFLEPDATGAFAWGTPDYGDDGTFTGKLLETGESNCNATTAGYYKIAANTGALTYSATLTNWGLIGDGTPTGWDSDTDMTYDPATKKWTLTVALTAASIKFRSNDDWGLNYGDSGADGSLNEGGDNIAVPAAGTYLVTLDLSNPRNYTYSLELQ